MNINLQSFVFIGIKKLCSYLSSQFHGIHWIALINSADLDLEGLLSVWINSAKEVNYGLAQGIHLRKLALSVSLNCHCGTDSGYTEHCLKR